MARTSYGADSGFNWQRIFPDGDVSHTWASNGSFGWDDIDEGYENFDRYTSVISIGRVSSGTTTQIEHISLSNLTQMFGNVSRHINITYSTNFHVFSSGDSGSIDLELLVNNTVVDNVYNSIGGARWYNYSNQAIGWQLQNFSKNDLDNASIRFTGTITMVGKAHDFDLSMTVMDINVSFIEPVEQIPAVFNGRLEILGDSTLGLKEDKRLELQG